MVVEPLRTLVEISCWGEARKESCELRLLFLIRVPAHLEGPRVWQEDTGRFQIQVFAQSRWQLRPPLSPA